MSASNKKTVDRAGETAEAASPPALFALFIDFFRLGLTAFGGPAMVAYIRELAVARRHWLHKENFQDGVVLVQSVPGATAMQMAAYVGLKARGIPGAVLTYAGFALPSFILMLSLTAAYAHGRDLPSFVALFSGLQVIVVAIVARATWSFGLELLHGLRVLLLATAAALLLWFGYSPFLVIAGAAVLGMVIFRGKAAAGTRYGVRKQSAEPVQPGEEFQGAQLKKYLLQLATLVTIPIIALSALAVIDAELARFALLMLRIDVFAFGGGFASLPLMLHEIVDAHGWLDSKTFMDGIALGQVTPGPIVITTTFAGYLIYGLPGAFIGTAAIFTPSFLLVVGVSPVFDRLKNNPWFIRATTGILASFVGLLLFVTVKFAMAVPWDPLRVILGLSAFVALMRKLDILYVVLIGAALSLLLFR